MKIYRASLFVVQPKLVDSKEFIASLSDYREKKIAVIARFHTYRELATSVFLDKIPEAYIRCQGLISNWVRYPIGIANLEEITPDRPELLTWLGSYLTDQTKEKRRGELEKWCRESVEIASMFLEQNLCGYTKLQEQMKQKVKKKLPR